jgi:hypothetical protein
MLYSRTRLGTRARLGACARRRAAPSAARRGRRSPQLSAAPHPGPESEPAPVGGAAPEREECPRPSGTPHLRPTPAHRTATRRTGTAVRQLGQVPQARRPAARGRGQRSSNEGPAATDEEHPPSDNLSGRCTYGSGASRPCAPCARQAPSDGRPVQALVTLGASYCSGWRGGPRQAKTRTRPHGLARPDERAVQAA